MEFRFTYHPDRQEIEAINVFLSQQKSVSFQQLPEWTISDNNDSKTCFCYLKNNDSIIAYTKVIERRFGIGSITFGPLALDTEILCLFLPQLFAFYRKKSFSSITIQPGFFYDQFSVSKNLPGYKFIHKPELLNWATLRLNIECPLDEIVNNFSSHHKKELKRGLKANLNVKKIETLAEVKKLSALYTKMYKERKLETNEDFNKIKFDNIFNFISQKKGGFIVGVYTQENILVSGLIILYQGKEAFYYIGASDPDFKKLPINYPGMHKALELTKENGFKTFDFGGYKPGALESDQVYYINWFKKGFGGSLVIYPKTVIVPLNRFYFRIVSCLLYARNKLKKIRYKG